VLGVDLLRQQNQADHVPYVRKRTSPFIATLLSVICPGLGAAYNGQTVKAIVYFAVFVGLFQMAVLTGAVLFVFGFMGMWFFAALDSWRTAQMIRSGLTADVAGDILVKRFSGNPRLWGGVLTVLGVSFLFQRVFALGFLMRAIMPVMLIGLGIYLLRGYIFKPASAASYDSAPSHPSFSVSQVSYGQSERPAVQDFADRTRTGSWRDI
jgi:hypothetical protein